MLIKFNTDVFTPQLTDVRSADLGVTPSLGVKPNLRARKPKVSLRDHTLRFTQHRGF